MTNKEVLIQALQNFDGEYENDVTSYIACPNIKNCLLDKAVDDNNFDALYQDLCAECKSKWLLKEWEE